MKQTLLFLTILFSIALLATDKTKTVTLNVSGMTCQSCAGTVEKALKSVDGVKEAKVDLKKKQATVTLGNTKATAAVLIKAVGNAGFDATEGKTMQSAGKKQSGSDDGCDGDCCDGDCDSDAKPAKNKKTESKKS